MGSIITAWVATHTGLPSLRVSGPGAVRAGDRVVATLGAGAHLLSDPLAPAGVETIYTLDASTATLTRRAAGRRRAIVTDARGRGTELAELADTGDSTDWDPGATRFPSGAVRYSMHERPIAGSTVLRTMSPAAHRAVLEVVRRRRPLILATGAPVDGLDPVRYVLVRDVASTLLGGGAMQVVTIRWESLPVPSRGLAAPVVTWGEAKALGWQHLSAVGYAQAIAGMP